MKLATALHVFGNDGPFQHSVGKKERRLDSRLRLLALIVHSFPAADFKAVSIMSPRDLKRSLHS